MTAPDNFSQQVKDVLSHLYDYPYLESHILASQFWPNAEQAGPNRAQRLNRLFLETIEALYPPSALGKDTARAKCYSLLVYRYVEERPLEDIMTELGYSRRQFFREQRKAIEMLAAELQEKLPQDSEPDPQAEESLDTETERFVARQRAVNLTEVVRDTLLLVENLAQTHQVEISYQSNKDLPPVYGSRTLIRQVFLNCLSNIIKQPNTQQISVNLQPEEQRVLSTLTASLVSDKSAPPLNFESVQHLVKKLNGNWQEPITTTDKMICRFGLPTSVEKIVLVIEDNESVIKAFQRYLHGYNYRVVGVTVSGDALQTARQVKPAAITLDIMMPNQDGWETLQVLKNDPDTGHIPVVICSVLEDPDLAISLGAAGYLAKPVTQTKLVMMLNQLT